MPRHPLGDVNLGGLAAVNTPAPTHPGSGYLMQSGFALVMDDMQELPNLDGAVIELRVCGPGMLGGNIRIPGHQADPPTATGHGRAG